MDREPMTDKERDDALIAEKKRLAYFLECKEGTLEAEAMFRRAAALLRGDEPAKPDRYAVIAEEITSAANIVSHGGYYELDIEAATAVLRKHFEPSAEVVEALERLVAVIKMAGVANLSRGVQLGQISWSVKCSDAIEWAEKALSQLDGAKGGE